MRRLQSVSAWYLIVAAAYLAGYLLMPPRVLLIVDEERYVLQARAFAEGQLTLPGANLVESERPTRTANDHAPGTSLLQTPFVAAGGWQFAGLASVLGFIGLLVFTERLLRSCGHSGRFAIVIPLYLGALFFGRIAMSDAPNAALVALSLWLLVCDGNTSGRRAFAAGLTCGATLLFREPSAILLAPVAIGALLRRTVPTKPFLAGACAALVVRSALSYWLFEDPFFMRESDYRFSLASAGANLGVYAVVLLVMLPFGAILPLLYRGPRRTELIAAAFAYLVLFLSYDYRPWAENGVVKGTVLASRFVLPLLPVFALMLADVASRTRLSEALTRRADAAFALLVGAAAVAGFGIHPLVRRLESEPYQIVHAIQRHSEPGLPTVINEKAAAKYLSAVYGARTLLSRTTPLRELEAICVQRRGLQIILLDRDDSQLFRDDAAANAMFLDAAARRLRLTATYEGTHDGARLRMFGVRSCSGNPPA